MHTATARLAVAFSIFALAVACGEPSDPAAPDLAVDFGMDAPTEDLAASEGGLVDALGRDTLEPDGPTPDLASDMAVDLAIDAGPTAFTADELQAIFASRCVGCHIGGNASGGLALDPDLRTQTVNVPALGALEIDRIEPGDHRRSYLFHKLAYTYLDVGGSGDPMPLGPGRFTDFELERLALFIDGLPVELREQCEVEGDEDGDSLADCDDPDCQAAPTCQSELCENGADDDGDLAADCDDDDCAGFPACLVEICGNDLDDDQDTFDDCDDDDCLMEAACRVPYSEDEIQGLFNIYCAGCHTAGGASGGLRLDPPFAANTVNLPAVRGLLDRIEPGDRQRSFLFRKIEGAQVDVGGGDPMPPPPRVRLQALQIERIGLWIDSLAPIGDPELCGNLIDDNGDGFIDCDDARCSAELFCQAEDCDDRVDNDGDFLVDCFDPECGGAPGCGAAEDCGNLRDDDGDGLVDCADPGCDGDPACAAPEVCDNGADDDGDGFTDCADADCVGTAACRAGEDCDNLADDDGDGLVDCADPSCVGNAVCLRAEVCDNGRDDDGDGQSDCADADCAGGAACRVEVCNDQLDNDLDGFADCDDAECNGQPVCGVEACANGLDDNLDGLTDCADPDCAAALVCADEICDDQVDNDLDRLVDCADPDCIVAPYCLPEICGNGIDDNRRDGTDCADPDCALVPACGDEICDNGIDDNANGQADCLDVACALTRACLAPYTQQELQVLFNGRCGCHMGPAPSGQMSLLAPFTADTVNIRAVRGGGLDLIEPGDPANSFLMRKLLGTQGALGGIRMPSGGALTAAEIARIGFFIDDYVAP